MPDSGAGADAGDVAAGSTLDQLIAYNADIMNYAAFMLLRQILRGVPSVFKLIQGGSQWTAELRQGDETVATVAAAVSELLVSLRGLRVEGNAEAVLDEAMAECKQQQNEILRRAELYGEAILPGKEGFDAADVPSAKELHKANRKAAKRALKKTLKDAVAALEGCAGISKLETVLADLQLRERFALQSRELEPSPTDLSKAWAFFGVTDPSKQKYEVYTRLTTQWQMVRSSWAAKAAPPSDSAAADKPLPVKPKAAYHFWQSVLVSGGDEIAPLALRHLLRPVSSASVERVFSYLTDMDDPSRMSMKGGTLHDSLFLRANWRVVHQLTDDMAEEVRPKAASGGARVGEKRSRLEAGIAAAASHVHEALADEGEAVEEL